MKTTHRCNLCKCRSRNKCLMGHEIYYNEDGLLFGYYTDFDCQDYSKTVEEAERRMK
jgi:hypothetical protein